MLAVVAAWGLTRALVEADRERFALRIDRTVPLGLPELEAGGGGAGEAPVRGEAAREREARAAALGQIEMLRTCATESGLAQRLDRCLERAGVDALRRTRALAGFVAALAELRGSWEAEVLRGARANPMMLAHGDVLFSVLGSLGLKADVDALRLSYDEAGAEDVPRATCRYAPGGRDFAVDVVTREGCFELRFALGLAPRGAVRRLEELFAPMLEDLGAVSASGAQGDR